jgi:hypothetical protein
MPGCQERLRRLHLLQAGVGLRMVPAITINETGNSKKMQAGENFSRQMAIIPNQTGYLCAKIRETRLDCI